MNSPTLLTASLPLAEVGQPLFGNQWLALLAVLAGVAALMAAIAAMGRWLAATHPDAPPRPAPVPAPAAVDAEPPPEVIAVIAAAVAFTLGSRARVAAVVPVKTTPQGMEHLQPWSVEGRRQIYSSHQVR